MSSLPEVTLSVEYWNPNQKDFFGQACALMQASSVESHGPAARIDAGRGMLLWKSGQLIVFAARTEDKVCGICLLTKPTPAINHGRIESTLLSIYIVPDLRKTHIAAQLMDFAEQVVFGLGAQDIVAGARGDTESGLAALEFWESCGFAPAGVTMIKTLAVH